MYPLSFHTSPLRRPATLCVSSLRAVWVGFGVAVLAMASHVAMPIFGSVVPATLQPQAVVLVAALWPPGLGLAAVVSWLGLGFAGAPVFAHGGGGSWVWLMPTAGYLLAYVPVALLLGRVRPASFFGQLGVWCGASMLVLVLGALWLSLFVGPGQALRMGIAPFVCSDLLKCAMAAALMRTVQSRLHRP